MVMIMMVLNLESIMSLEDKFLEDFIAQKLKVLDIRCGRRCFQVPAVSTGDPPSSLDIGFHFLKNALGWSS